MPVNAEILADDPVISWYLLQRPNYWSPFQAAGAIFSKDKALLVERRGSLLAAARQLVDLRGIKTACGDTSLGYVIRRQPVAPTPYPAVAFSGREARGHLYLYRCADLRG
jgi:hypothetical protein